MIVFITRILFIVVIVILSLKNIIAPPVEPWQMPELEYIRSECVKRIIPYFPGENLREHAHIAMNTYVNKEYMDGDFFGYYSALKNNSDIGTIPEIEIFCQDYYQRSPDISTLRLDIPRTIHVGISSDFCKSMLLRIYGNDRRLALDKVFFEYLPKDVDAKFQRMKNMLTTGDPYYKTTSIVIPNVAMHYWLSILNNFELKIGGENMLPPKEFCDKIHTTV